MAYSEPEAGRIESDEQDGRRRNAGPSGGLTATLIAASKEAPASHSGDTIEIVSVAWASYESGRPVTEIWSEVAADG